MISYIMATLPELIKSLGLAPDQVARDPNQINQNTKAYVGSLVHPDGQGGVIPIFRKLVGVDRIYTSPENRIRTEILEIDGRIRSAGQAVAELQQAGREVYKWSNNMLKKTPFTDKVRTVRLAYIGGFDLIEGFDSSYLGWTDVTERFRRIQTLGLEKCDPEIAVYQGINKKNLPEGQDRAFFYMNHIIYAGRPAVFGLASEWLEDESLDGEVLKHFLNPCWADGIIDPLTYTIAVFPQNELVRS